MFVYLFIFRLLIIFVFIFFAFISHLISDDEEQNKIKLQIWNEFFIGEEAHINETNLSSPWLGFAQMA